jgi:hypothetical protein
VSFDAILIPGGGVREGGALPLWVEARVARAVALYGGEYVIALSGGAAHRPPPLDPQGFPIFESAAVARRLIELGIPRERVLTETASYDTIGNAYFARVMHTDPAGLRRLAVVTSGFHMPRTERIFRWVFGLAPGAEDYSLRFFTAEDAGLEGEPLRARVEKERESIAQLEETAAGICDLKSLQRWLFLHHTAYAAGGRRTLTDAAFRDTY